MLKNKKKKKLNEYSHSKQAQDELKMRFLTGGMLEAMPECELVCVCTQASYAFEYIPKCEPVRVRHTDEPHIHEKLHQTVSLAVYAHRPTPYTTR